MSEAGTGGRLDPPQVPPTVYDEEYYRAHCMGAPEWVASEGRDPHGIYPAALQLAGFAAGESVLDVGCGRGELVALAAREGARRAVGVEQSPDGLRLAERTARALCVTASVELRAGDARALPVGDGEFDLLTMLDVIEHLAPDEQSAALSEALRALRPGGRLLVHTAPNRLVYDVTYRAMLAIRPLRTRSWPREPRNRHELLMHVGEHSPRSLRRALERAGFEGVTVRSGPWVYTGFVPEEWGRRAYRALARLRPTRALAAMDLIALARRPAR